MFIHRHNTPTYKQTYKPLYETRQEPIHKISLTCRVQISLQERRPTISSRVPRVVSQRAELCGAEGQNYMEYPSYSQDPPGALGLGRAGATRIYCAFYVFYYTTPLPFAILADKYLGRFKTLYASFVIYLLGCGALTATSFPSSIKQGMAAPGIIAGMALIGLGGGGVRAVVVPFLVDQCTNEQPRRRVLGNGQMAVVDMRTLRYICSLYFWVANAGSLSIIATTILEKRYSFGYAYLTGLGSISVALLMLGVGKNYFNRVAHHGNVLPTAGRILACAAREGFSMSRANPPYQQEQYGKAVPWRAETVGELCRGLRACRVLQVCRCPFVVFYICFDQMQNNLVSQAAQMESGWIPNDMVSIINPISCIVFGPLIQHVLYPYLERRKMQFEPILRITTGFVFMALAMLYATLVQHIIYTSEPCYKLAGECARLDRVPNKVTVLDTMSGLFSCVTALEYACALSPKSMEAIIQAINMLTAGAGSACAMALTPMAKDPSIKAFYASLACAMAVTAAVFWWGFQAYDKLDAQESPIETDGQFIESS
ncbi:hypothetical protein GQ44DRAFT_744903 [Phaeosphaeriaceae sp. PMI808]|nr:hypothetical protein GQ44DRAFT_744903 [Phaeosphaeriaceae sp. PMI808]